MSSLRLTLPLLFSVLGCSSPEAAPAGSDNTGPDDATSAKAASAASAEVAQTQPLGASSGEPNEVVLSGSAVAPAASSARALALADAREHGMIGLLNAGGGDPDAPKSPWSEPAKGNIWGDEIGDAFGAGGLGLSGIGEQGVPNRGEGIGLGSIGTIGHGAGTGTGQIYGSGSGRLGGAHRAKPPTVRMGAVSVSGKLPPEVIQRIVRQNFGRFRLCYEQGLRTDASLQGTVIVSFTIATDGSVSGVKESGDLPSAAVKACIAKAFGLMTFPSPESGVVKVSYPIKLEPGDGPSGASASGAGGASAGPTVGGKPLAEATGVEVEKALRDAGCSDVSSAALAGGKSAMVYTVKKGGKTFTVTFAPASAGSAAIPEAERTRLESAAAVRRAGAFFLAVEGEDKAAAKALLDGLFVG